MYLNQVRNSLVNGLEDLANKAASIGDDTKVTSLLRLMLDLTGKGTALGDTFIISLHTHWHTLNRTLSISDWAYLSSHHGVSLDKLERVTA